MVTLSGVSKRYGSTTVLQQVDLAIAQGEFVSLIGPSGCGKSTLLKLISGLTSASAGSILVDAVTPVERPSPIFFKTRPFCPGAPSRGMWAWDWS
jgi:multiple sugar transport system ATP-binding protein